MEKVIVKSGKLNWSGKEFSDNPAKVYNSFIQAAEAINDYHFYEWKEKSKEFEYVGKKQKIEFFFLSENRFLKLLSEGKVRI